MILFADPFDGHRAPDMISEATGPLARHLEANHAFATLGLKLGPLCRCLGHPPTATEERTLFLLRGGAFGLHLLRRGVIPVSQSTLQQRLHRGLVAFQFLRLIVGSVRAADFGSLIPVDAEPAKAVQDRLERFSDVA